MAPELRVLRDLDEIADESSKVICLLQELLFIRCWLVQLYLIVFLCKTAINLVESLVDVFILLFAQLNMEIEILLELTFEFKIVLDLFHELEIAILAMQIV